MRFLIFGAGGVGGFFGAKLAQAGEEVWFLGRGAHLETMRTKGLRVLSTSGELKVPPGTMSDRIEEIPSPDVVLFCVKSYDTEAAADKLNTILTDNSIVLSLQNGIDNEEKLLLRLRKGQVYAGAAYISSRITAPGVITETGGLQRIVFGPFNRPIDRQATALQAAFTSSGIKAELRQEMIEELWRKFIFITSMGSMTALTRLTHGELLLSPETMAVVFDAMKEASAVARAEGITLLPISPEKIIEGLKRFDPDTRSSMYYDLVGGKPLELEALNGTIVRLGTSLRVPTPIHRTIYASLLPFHLKNQRQAGQ